MCATEEEAALRSYQISRLRILVKSYLRVSGILFVLVGLDAIFLSERIPHAPSYRFIFGWDTFSWWPDLAVAWGVLFVAAGVLLVASSTLYPHLLRLSLGLAIAMTSWWAGGLVVEAVWAEVVHRNPEPTLYPMFSWVAWCTTLVLINLIPRVAPDIGGIHVDNQPTTADIQRAMRGELNDNPDDQTHTPSKPSPTG